MAAPFRIVAIDHIVLSAADPAALEWFYLDVLGLIFETRQGKLAQLRVGRALSVELKAPAIVGER